MIRAISIWLLVATFSDAGLFNAIGTRSTREGFVRWGYPPPWRTGPPVAPTVSGVGLHGLETHASHHAWKFARSAA